MHTTTWKKCEKETSMTWLLLYPQVKSGPEMISCPVNSLRDYLIDFSPMPHTMLVSKTDCCPVLGQACKVFSLIWDGSCISAPSILLCSIQFFSTCHAVWRIPTCLADAQDVPHSKFPLMKCSLPDWSSLSLFLVFLCPPIIE